MAATPRRPAATETTFLVAAPLKLDVDGLALEPVPDVPGGEMGEPVAPEPDPDPAPEPEPDPEPDPDPDPDPVATTPDPVATAVPVANPVEPATPDELKNGSILVRMNESIQGHELTSKSGSLCRCTLRRSMWWS